MQRITTGVDALDGVLDRGAPKGSVVFVAGLPGAGKTILCEQALFANAASMPSVLYATTLSEPAIKMLRFSPRRDAVRRTVRGQRRADQRRQRQDDCRLELRRGIRPPR